MRCRSRVDCWMLVLITPHVTSEEDTLELSIVQSCLLSLCPSPIAPPHQHYNLLFNGKGKHKTPQTFFVLHDFISPLHVLRKTLRLFRYEISIEKFVV